ncbi:MAG TPA: response regulator transcription factor [Usitatibacter sp.]|jgi:DNA-binding response OmpR family regulator|nr:response regulator transcription factor [Usitatibacter sp.]
MRILLLEDDPIQLELARSWLEGNGHAVTGVSSGKAALKVLERDSFELAIFDWMVPDLSGEELLRWVRQRQKRLPVMFATARDEELEIATVLNLGADDYVVKPLRRLEFLARVDALGRRAGLSGAELEEAFDIGPYRIDPRRRTICLEGRAVKMTPRMADVALLLFRKRGELVSRAQLYEQVWGHPEALDSRTVDTHVSRLRQALELDGRHGWRLSAVYHHGYRLENASPAA